MNNKSNEIQIQLFDENGNAHTYKLGKVFSVGEPEQLYCSAFAVEGTDIRFFKYSVSVKDTEAEITLSDIEDGNEYDKVADAYQSKIIKTAIDLTAEELSERDDFVVLTDTKGNKVPFILHLVFSDETNKRSYIAVQQIDDAGDIVDDIVFYLLREENDNTVIDMIPSDMEYEKARRLFMNLIEQEREIFLTN